MCNSYGKTVPLTTSTIADKVTMPEGVEAERMIAKLSMTARPMVVSVDQLEAVVTRVLNEIEDLWVKQFRGLS